MSSFWGALVKPDTPHSTNTPSSLEITLATLGSTTKDCEAVLFLKLQDAPHVVKPIATLRNNSKSQTIRMNLSLEKHVSFELSVRGAPVHVSGYLEPDEDDDMSEAGDEDPFARWTGGQEGSESEDEDEDEDEESSEEEEVSGGQKRPAPDHSADAKRAKLDQQTQQAKKQAEQKAKQAKQQAEQKAKQQAEQKAKQQAEQKAKQQAEQKAKQQAEQKAKQAEQKAAAAPLKKTTLAGGLEIQDMQVGKGKFAQSGKQIVVGYFGKLTNGKKFDSSSNFRFRLGVGEVIKGWDMGFAGMREGGKRRIKVPAALGYGKRGAPPQIPGNATLLFDIELKKVL